MVESVDYVDRTLGAERFFEQLARIIDAARGYELGCHHKFLELGKHLIFLLGLYRI